MHAIYRWVWTLGPGNPMIARIVQGGSRRAQHLWVRMGYLGALIALVLVGLLSGGGMQPQVSLTDLAKSGTWVFGIVAYGQVILVCLLAPLFMAGAIGREQQGQTFDILLTTPMSNLQIVLGSLLGRLFFILALLLSGLPLFAVLLVFGGVPIASVFVAFAVAALTAISVGAVAVTISVLRAGGRKAVFMFVVAVGAYLIGAYALDVVLLRRVAAAADSTTWLTPLHPLLVLEASLNSANYRAPGPEVTGDLPWLLRFYLGRPFAAFAVLSLLGSAVLMVVSSLVLRQLPSLGLGEPRWLRWLKRKLRLPVAEGGGERRRPGRDVWQNPVAWREANTRGKVMSGIAARWGFAVLALGAGAGLLAAYHFEALPIVPGPGGRPMPAHELFHAALLTLLLLEVAVVTMVAIYMSAGAVSKEREDGTLDLMLTTPITPRFYIWGKLRGVVSFLSLLIALPVLTLAMVAVYSLAGPAMGWEQATWTYSGVTAGGGRVTTQAPMVLPEAPLLLLAMLVPFVALCVMAGMSWSIKARGVLGAVVPTVGIVGVLALVLGLCGVQAAASVAFVGPVLNAFSPATNVMMVINPYEHVAGFAGNEGMSRMGLAAAAGIAAVGYSGIVYAMLMGMVRGFDHTVRKLSGTG
ncbi:ABC transporter permease [Phycisphaerales bacterium AB-hyl4]|uniref:ABC transporter permease n=1 Tax=Natronomicrosphaera hydrolytica TaxID=3242702 RepID=A0ABV4U600_9BACT